MTEYNLNFFEAMEALRESKIVQSELGCKFQVGADSEIIRETVDTKRWVKDISFSPMEIRSKWRIVEPEKCWLDENFIFESWQREGAIKLAKEAIKRIEVLELELRKNSGHNIETVLTGSIRILKNLIGEK